MFSLVIWIIFFFCNSFPLIRKCGTFQPALYRLFVTASLWIDGKFFCTDLNLSKTPELIMTHLFLLNSVLCADFILTV